MIIRPGLLVELRVVGPKKWTALSHRATELGLGLKNPITVKPGNDTYVIALAAEIDDLDFAVSVTHADELRVRDLFRSGIEKDASYAELLIVALPEWDRQELVASIPLIRLCADLGLRVRCYVYS